MGRHRLEYHWLRHSGRQVESPSGDEIETLTRWELYYRAPYSQMVGARVRRARMSRGLTQAALLKTVERPRGGCYSRALLSRIEKGHANSPLYVCTCTSPTRSRSSRGGLWARMRRRSRSARRR